MGQKKWESTGFGAQLLAAREDAGLSQAELACAVSVQVSTISRLERGLQEPSWPLVRRLAAALGVDVSTWK